MRRWPIDSDPRPTLLDLMRDTEPRFERPDRPAHTYAQATRRTLAAQHHAKTAAQAGHPRSDAA